MKKIFMFLLLIFLFNTALWNEETPDQAMDKLLGLFKQYNVTSIPENISIKILMKKLLIK